MAQGERRRLRPFPGVRLEFGRDGVRTAVSERIALGKGLYGEPVLPIVRTAGIGELRRILEAAALRHADLSREIAQQEAALADVRAELRVAQLFVMRLVTAARVRSLAEEGQSSIAAISRDRAEREAGKVEVGFSIDAATAVAYAALTRAFEDLAGSARIWDVGAGTAEAEADWVPVAFSVGPSDIVACRDDVLRAPGRRGRSLQIFPGFVLLREGGDAMVLEHGDVELELTPTRFMVENEALPGGAKVVDEIWPAEDAGEEDTEAKAPLPVVEYGEMKVRSTDGSLDNPSVSPPAYMFSSFAKARLFVEAYRDFQSALAAITETDSQPPDDRPRTAVTPPTEPPPLDIKPRERLWMDWVALVALVFLIGLPFALIRPAPPAPPPPARPQAAAHLAIANAAAPKSALPVHPTARPKRAARVAKQAGGPVEELCGLVRQSSGELKLIPCEPTAAPSGPPSGGR